MTTTATEVYHGSETVKKTDVDVRDRVMMSLSIRYGFLAKAEMALFGMVWLLRVRAEMRRCAKCRKEELARLQKEQEDAQQQLQHHRSVEQQTDGAIAVIGTPDSVDCTSPSTTNTTFYNLDPPGPGGTYCEIHGYIPPREGNRGDGNFAPATGATPAGPYCSIYYN